MKVNRARFLVSQPDVRVVGGPIASKLGRLWAAAVARFVDEPAPRNPPLAYRRVRSVLACRWHRETLHALQPGIPTTVSGHRLGLRQQKNPMPQPCRRQEPPKRVSFEKGQGTGFSHCRCQSWFLVSALEDYLSSGSVSTPVPHGFMGDGKEDVHSPQKSSGIVRRQIGRLIKSPSRRFAGLFPYRASSFATHKVGG